MSWAFACWLILTEHIVPPGHGWQCSVCRHNWFAARGAKCIGAGAETREL